MNIYFYRRTLLSNHILNTIGIGLMASVMFSCGGNKAKAEKATRDIKDALKRGENIFPEVLTEIEANKDVLRDNAEMIKNIVWKLNAGDEALNYCNHMSSFKEMGNCSRFYDAITYFQQGVEWLTQVHSKIGDDLRGILCPSALDPILKGWNKVLNTKRIRENTDEDLWYTVLDSLGNDEFTYFQTLNEKIKKIVEALRKAAGLE